MKLTSRLLSHEEPMNTDRLPSSPNDLRALLREALRPQPRRRAGVRGVTLVEVLIVVAIMALIAGGVGFLVLPKYRDSQVKQATIDARKIRGVATQYVALNGGGDCPTVESLIDAKELDSEGGGQDPWGQPFEITCSGDDIAVASNGPDQQAGTEDDIVVGDAGGQG